MALGAVARSDLADPAPYTKTFFDLQLLFAHRVSALSGLPLARVILEYTNFYIRFGLGREFNPADPAWTEYLAGLQHANDPGDWTYRFHLAHSQAVVPPGLVASFGCFSYSRLRDDRVRLSPVVDFDVFAFIFRKLRFKGGRLLARELRVQRPIFHRIKRADFALPLHDHSQCNGLHAAGGQSTTHLIPQQRRNFVANDAVEYTPRLLRVH